MSDARQYTAIVIVLLIMPDSGYYAARQRRAIAVTRQWDIPDDATTLLVSVERWPDGTQNLPRITTLATLKSNAVMYRLAYSRMVSANVPR
jgi:hypothetical protein